MPKHPYAITIPADFMGVQIYIPAMQFEGYQVRNECGDILYLKADAALEEAQKSVDDYNLQNVIPTT